MKSKKKFTCDYCSQKTFVTSKFFKENHKRTVNHILNRGQYYESLINQHKIKALKRIKLKRDQTREDRR